MGLIKTTTGTLGNTGQQTIFVQLTAQEVADVKKARFSVVSPDGGTSKASGFIGFAKTASNQYTSSYGRKVTSFDTEEHSDRCIHLFNYDAQNNKETLLSAEFVEFDKSFAAAGFLMIKLNVTVANPSYQYMVRLED